MDVILAQEPLRLGVLEIYYLCLTLGFKGRYQLVEQEKLRSRIEAARARLKQSTPMKAGTLSPHGLPRDQIAAEVKSKLPTWAVIATAVTIGVLIYLALSVYVSRKASGVNESIEALTANVTPSSQLSGSSLPIETVTPYA
jgi:type VI secretion system protein ImpK